MTLLSGFGLSACDWRRSLKAAFPAGRRERENEWNRAQWEKDFVTHCTEHPNFIIQNMLQFNRKTLDKLKYFDYISPTQLSQTYLPTLPPYPLERVFPRLRP